MASQSQRGKSSAIFSKNDTHSHQFHCNSVLYVFWSSTYTKIAPSTKPIHFGESNSNKNKNSNIKNDTNRILAHAVFFILCHRWNASMNRHTWERGPKATWHAIEQGTRSWLFPKCLDTSCMGWCAGLVKANGRAEPTCKIYFLGIRSLDKSMNLWKETEEVVLKNHQEGKFKNHTWSSWSLCPWAAVEGRKAGPAAGLKTDSAWLCQFYQLWGLRQPTSLSLLS